MLYDMSKFKATAVLGKMIMVFKKERHFNQQGILTAYGNWPCTRNLAE
jgi:hypothetical protein